MTTHDWKQRTSEDEKRRLIGKEWGSVVRTYLWYEIGERRDLLIRERPNIIASFFISGRAGPGDIEPHRSEKLPGNPWLLRLRGELILRPSLTWGKGRYCALFQMGRMDEIGRPTDDYINFWERMDPNARASGHSHSDDV